MMVPARAAGDGQRSAARIGASERRCGSSRRVLAEMHIACCAARGGPRSTRCAGGGASRRESCGRVVCRRKDSYSEENGVCLDDA